MKFFVKLTWLTLNCIILSSLTSQRPLGGYLVHHKMTPKSLKYHRIIRNSMHDRIKSNRHRKLTEGEEYEEEVPFNSEEEEAWDQKPDEHTEQLGNGEVVIKGDFTDDDDLLASEDSINESTQNEETSEKEEEKEEEEVDLGDGTELEHTIVSMQLDKIEGNLEVFKELIIKCIDRFYAANMFADQKLVSNACLGPGYEIINRNYQMNLFKVQMVFDPIWKHKVKTFKERYRDDIYSFFQIVRELARKDLQLLKSLEIGSDKLKYTLDKRSLELIMEDVNLEIIAFDDARQRLLDIKQQIADHLALREREKQDAIENLEEHEQVELENEDARLKHQNEDLEEIHHEKEGFEDGYAEEATNLDDSEEESEFPEESSEVKEEDTFPYDERDEYDASAPSVGPGGDPSEDSMSSGKMNELLNDSTIDPDQSEIKVDRPDIS